MAEGVAPVRGAWIEILTLRRHYNTSFVAPVRGAWIEMVLKVINNV